MWMGYVLINHNPHQLLMWLGWEWEGMVGQMNLYGQSERDERGREATSQQLDRREKNDPSSNQLASGFVEK
jgi:hypothetical protein